MPGSPTQTDPGLAYSEAHTLTAGGRRREGRPNSETLGSEAVPCLREMFGFHCEPELILLLRGPQSSSLVNEELLRVHFQRKHADCSPQKACGVSCLSFGLSHSPLGERSLKSASCP